MATKLTPNMRLIYWELGEDFSHEQLLDNWKVLDKHNHAGAGEGVQIPEGGIENEAVSESKIKNRAVGSPKIAIEGVIGEEETSPGVWTVINIKKESVGPKNVRSHSLTGEQIESYSLGVETLKKEILPIGMTIDWYNSGFNEAPTGIWHVCDGTPWAEITNAMGSGGGELKTGHIPNLLGKFRRGSKSNETGQTGGSEKANLEHYHEVAHHAHNVKGHTHATFDHNHAIANDSHGHAFKTESGTWNLFDKVIKYLQLTPGSKTGGTMFVSEVMALTTNFSSKEEHEAKEEGGPHFEVPLTTYNHSHGGGTGLAGAGQTGSQGTETENGYAIESSGYPKTSGAILIGGSPITTVNTEPPWIGFLPIMRVK